jgi:undecaprenyl phosphate-alpha-L-ara4N flippase subunit ArnE
MLALLLGALLGALGQVFLKLGATGASSFDQFVNTKIAAGLIFYAVGTGLWVWSLSRVPLSVAYGFTALTFVLVFAASVFIVGERVGGQTLAGLAAVLFGFILIATA